jgi:NAD(P)-dependent dehydrogenase (short-subunit alcohol dehydrogenase family)
LPLNSSQLRISEVFSVAGRTVVITGASGFLGRTFVTSLLANGARVVALGRSERLVREADAWGKEFGADRISIHRVDMYDIPALSQILDRIAAEEPAIDVLVNNAHELGSSTGFNVPEGSLESATLDTWMRNLTGGVYWAALTTQKLGARMKQQRSGQTSSIPLAIPHQKLHSLASRAT